MHSHHRIPFGWLALVALAFILGLAAAGPGHLIFADATRSGGYDNQVLEITAAGAGLKVRQAPNTTAAEIDTLYWGDRVLWAGDATNAGGYRWLKVGIADGRTGWMADVAGWTIDMDPVYTTPGMGLGAVVRVTPEGDASHCRVEPSAASTEFETMQTNDQMTVISGPYQAEYWVWWQYRLSNGYECWIVDVPGWFNVVTAGTF